MKSHSRPMVPRSFYILLIAIITLIVPPLTAAQGKPLVVATTGMVADLVRQIAGDTVQLHTLMGPGVDPHLYKPTPGALKALRDANLILYNGLHLEGKLGEALASLAKEKSVIAVAAAIDQTKLIAVDGAQGIFDPHVWLDASLWSECIAPVQSALQKLVPQEASQFATRGAAHQRELLAVHEWSTNQIRSIPEMQRVLITAHDAFGYFGRAYGIEVHALQGISTTAEFGLHDIVELSELVVKRRVPALFIETSISPRFIEAVQAGVRERGLAVAIGGALYSDALGSEGSGAETVAGMLRSNVLTIVNALQAPPPAANRISTQSVPDTQSR